MAISKLLGCDRWPRLGHLRARRLHVPRDIAVPAALHPVVDADVSLSQVEARWAQLIRVTASIEGGWLSAGLALTRFGAAARADPIQKAGNALGQLWRSLFLGDYLSNEGVRRESLRILNRGESVHTLQRIMHDGSLAAARGRRHEDLLAISGSLTLLTNMVMAWTTQRMQQVWDRWQRTATRRVEPALLRHIGPMPFQNINLRGEMAFPLARYRSRLITQQLDLSGAVGRLVAGVLFGLAEIEHEYRQERQAAGIAVAKRKRRYHGWMKGTTKAQPARAWLLYDRGCTVVEIMQALQISRRTVYRYLAAEGKA